MTSGEGLPRGARIRHTEEIRSLLRRGRRKRTGNLDVFFAPSPASCSRLALIVPKHGRRIVERNRLKRRLREIGRRDLLPLLDRGAGPADLLVRARGRAYGLTFPELREEVRSLVEALCSPAS